MGKGRVAATVSAGITAILAVATPLAAQQVEINPFALRLLAAHNDARDAVDVPRLGWSADLARDAQGWADHLARQGRMEHASREARQGRGENLWMGNAGTYSAETMIAAFVDERRYFTNGDFPAISTTDRWQDVGHYTQVVWRKTQEVGCAVARGERDDFLVCRYWPAGNVYGRKAY